jgi:hypothetical protein
VGALLFMHFLQRFFIQGGEVNLFTGVAKRIKNPSKSQGEAQTSPKLD